MLSLREVKLQQHFTEAPQHLSESELLELMDRHGIGTSVVGGWGCCSVEEASFWKKHGKNQEVPPPTPFVENMGGGKRRIGFCWLVILGMSWMWGLEIFGGTKDGLESFPLFLLGP